MPENNNPSTFEQDEPERSHQEGGPIMRHNGQGRPIPNKSISLDRQAPPAGPSDKDIQGNFSSPQEFITTPPPSQADILEHLVTAAPPQSVPPASTASASPEERAFRAASDKTCLPSGYSSQISLGKPSSAPVNKDGTHPPKRPRH